MSDIFIGSFTTLIGALGGSILTFLHTYWIKKRDEKNQLKSFLNAIKTEISCVWNSYYENIGHLVEDISDGDGLIMEYPIFDNYFVVYDNNTNLIGNLDNQLSESLINTYIASKGLKDSLLCNNRLLMEVKKYLDLTKENGNDLCKNSHYSFQHQNYLEIWQSYGKKIQEMHFKVKHLKDLLIYNIDSRLREGKYKMSEKIQNNLDEQKELAYYSALVDAWIMTRMEKDKQLIALSVAGIGVIVMFINEISTYLEFIFWIFSALSFILTIFFLLRVFTDNSHLIEDQINFKKNSILDDKVSKETRLAEKFFLFGIVCTVLVSFFQTKFCKTWRFPEMSNRGNQESSDSGLNTKGLSGISNISPRPQSDSNETGNRKKQ